MSVPEVIPTFAYERLAETSGLPIELLGYLPKDHTFTYDDDSKQHVVGRIDPQTLDVYHTPTTLSMAALLGQTETFVVNLSNPDLNYQDWLPAVVWVEGDCHRIPDASKFFYPDSADTSTAKKAKKICKTCPIAAECLAWAIVTNEPNGIWGGLGEDERRGIRRQFVLYPDKLADLCVKVADSLAIGERPHILRFRNTPGVTHGKVSTWNRGCDHGPAERADRGKSPACRACRAASMMAATRRRNKT